MTTMIQALNNDRAMMEANLRRVRANISRRETARAEQALSALRYPPMWLYTAVAMADVVAAGSLILSLFLVGVL